MSNKMSFNQDLSPQQGMEGGEEGADDVVARALGITKILSKILNYMDFSDLKETLLVNHLWKEKSQIYFKQRAQIDLMDSNRKFDKDLKQFIEFCKSHGNLTLRYSHYTPYLLKYGNREILHFVLSSPPPLIKSLYLYLDVTNSQDFTLKLILNNLSHLKELHLNVDAIKSDSLEELDFEKVFQAVPQLPLVTKFKIYFDRDLKESDEPKVQKLCQKLLFLTPNLEEITLHCYNSKFDVTYFEQIVRLQREWKDSKSKGPMPFQNLSSITITDSKNVYMSCLEFLQPLKGLGTFGVEAENKFTLQKILHKNSKTLENLEMSVMLGNHPKITLPVLPRLGRLSLAGRDVSNIRELFLMGSDEFCARFPKLHSLIFDDPKDFLPFHNCQLDLSFPQITSLKVTCMGRYNYTTWVEWTSKLFPNVHNSWINKARKNIQAKM